MPPFSTDTLRDRFRGAMLGLAVGDAVGTTLEFKRPGNFSPITDMVGGGPFSLNAGEWTDDTSMALCLASSLVECLAGSGCGLRGMALCLASSLVECSGFNAKDQMERYVRWWKEALTKAGFLETFSHQIFPKNRSTATTLTTMHGRLVPMTMTRIVFFSKASKRAQRAVSCDFMPLWPSSPLTTISKASRRRPSHALYVVITTLFQMSGKPPQSRVFCR